MSWRVVWPFISSFMAKVPSFLKDTLVFCTALAPLSVICFVWVHVPTSSGPIFWAFCSSFKREGISESSWSARGLAWTYQPFAVKALITPSMLSAVLAWSPVSPLSPAPGEAPRPLSPAVHAFTIESTRSLFTCMAAPHHFSALPMVTLRESIFARTTTPFPAFLPALACSMHTRAVDKMLSGVPLFSRVLRRAS